MWQWLSTPPGSTSLPPASISRRPTHRAAELDDPAVEDADVGHARASGRDDRAAADDEVEHGTSRLFDKDANYQSRV